MSLHLALSCRIGQCGIREAFLCSERCAICHVPSSLCREFILGFISLHTFFETVKLILQQLYLVLGADINYAWLAYQYSLYLSLIFPVWAVGKFSMKKDFVFCQAFSHPTLKDEIMKETCFDGGNLFN